MELTNLWGLASIPLILALVNILKPLVPDKRWYPLIAVAIAIGLNFIIGVPIGAPWSACLIFGIVAGLSACGLYSSGATIKLGAAAKK